MSLVFSASPTVRFATPSWSAVYAIGPGGRDREVAGQAAKTSTGVSSAGLKSSSESPKSRLVGRQKSVKIADAVPPIKWATAAALEVGNKTGPRSHLLAFSSHIPNRSWLWDRGPLFV